MVKLIGILILITVSTTVYADAEYPCDTATAYLTQFTLCYDLLGVYVQSLHLNTIYRNSDPIIVDAFTPDGWSDTDPDGIRACGVGIQEIRSCMSVKFASCEADVHLAVNAEIDRYRARLCENRDGTWVWSELSITYFEYIATGYWGFTEGSLDCISNLWSFASLTENTCYSVEFVAAYEYLSSNSLGALNGRLGSIYGSYFKCLYRQMIAIGCSNEFAVGYFSYTVMFGFVGVSFSIEQLDRLTSDEDESGPERITVAVFGDPHILAYVDEKQVGITCSAPGGRTYLKNNYIEAYGTNTLVDSQIHLFGPPTYMTEVVVMLNGDDVTATYTGSGSAPLPTTFVDGSSTVQEGGDKMTVKERRGWIQLFHKRWGIVVVIKRFGYTLGMWIRMEKSLYGSTDGDMVTYCLGEEINITAALENNRRRRDVSDEACSGIGLNEREINACLYDSNFGDLELVDETYSSLQESDEIVEELDEEIIVIDETTTPSASNVVGYMSVNLMIIVICGMLL